MADLKWCVALVDTAAVLPDGTHPVVFIGPATDARPGDTILVPETEQPSQYGSRAKCALADCEDPVIVKTVHKGADVFLCERHGLEVADG